MVDAEFAGDQDTRKSSYWLEFEKYEQRNSVVNGGRICINERRHERSKIRVYVPQVRNDESQFTDVGVD